MDTTAIKQEIDTNITTNGSGAITGAVLNTTLNDIVDAVDNGKLDASNLYNKLGFPIFFELATYKIGDLCVYNSTLYECTAQHIGGWNAAHFTATTLYNVISNL